MEHLTAPFPPVTNILPTLIDPSMPAPVELSPPTAFATPALGELSPKTASPSTPPTTTPNASPAPAFAAPASRATPEPPTQGHLQPYPGQNGCTWITSWEGTKYCLKIQHKSKRKGFDAEVYAFNLIDINPHPNVVNCHGPFDTETTCVSSWIWAWQSSCRIPRRVWHRYHDDHAAEGDAEPAAEGNENPVAAPTENPAAVTPQVETLVITSHPSLTAPGPVDLAPHRSRQRGPGHIQAYQEYDDEDKGKTYRVRGEIASGANGGTWMVVSEGQKYYMKIQPWEMKSTWETEKASMHLANHTSDLWIHRIKTPTLQLPHIKIYTRQVAEGLVHLHAIGIIQGDIIPANLIVHDAHVFIVDFVASDVLDERM
ncbi:hypothetical protein BGX23_012059 [Mortierella sp. AD031]|nr:hypothetical protein BGX23_012059 [Mortierella sp. AD031]